MRGARAIGNRDEGEPMKKSIFDKLKRGLFMTHTEVIDRVKGAVKADLGVDRNVMDALEEGLLAADVGAELTMELMDKLAERVKNDGIRSFEGLAGALRAETRALIPPQAGGEIDLGQAKPFVILVVGVNGTGKTTTIAKLAQRWTDEGRKVLLGAADTFRAAAIDQLQLWADRVGVPMIRHKPGSDPGAVAHDAIAAAKSRAVDVVLIDTAGRLHNKSHLMEELSKIRRVIGKELPGAPHETLLVLDGTTGQNGVSQAKAFLEAADVTGIVVTKLDGTAKGGVILSIMKDLSIPVKFVGVGETAEDLLPFEGEAFLDALFEE